MDIIDDSISNYESVVGMSVLDEDGILPIVVVCEVIEEELELHPGFRGVVSMEVGLRAVGRAKRWDGAGGAGMEGAQRRGLSNEASFRGRTALDAIHEGQFIDWCDDTLDIDGMEVANECLGNIESLLMLPSSSTTSSRQSCPSQSSTTQSSNKLQLQQTLYQKAYNSIIEHCNTAQDNPQHAKLTALSFAAFAAVESEDRSPFAIMQALTTKDTLERLRLGLALLLDDVTSDFDDISEEHIRDAFQ